MSRGRQYIEFKGYFAEGVLGIFRIIRGFADLRDLVAVSVPYKMEDNDQPYRVVSRKRTESEKHAVANNIIALRCSIMSNRWGDFWEQRVAV